MCKYFHFILLFLRCIALITILSKINGFISALVVKRLQQTWILCTCTLSDCNHIEKGAAAATPVLVCKREKGRLQTSTTDPLKILLGKAVYKTCWLCIKNPQLYQLGVPGWQEFVLCVDR